MTPAFSLKIIKPLFTWLLALTLCLFNEVADAQLTGLTPSRLMQQGEAVYHDKMYSHSAQLYDGALKLLTDITIGS
jgi:hypothetical protein